MLKKTLILLSLFAFTFLNACKTDATKKQKDVTAKEVDPIAEITRNLPDPCSFLDEAFVSSSVDIPAENVTIKRGGDSPAVPAKSCFYKWSGGEVGNAGLMIQALGNPIPDEFPQWAFFFIDNKKSQGEISMKEPDVPNKFTTIDIGEQGCYNHTLAKCYFRKGDTVFLIALNGVSDDDKKIDIYRAVSDRMLSMIK